MQLISDTQKTSEDWKKLRLNKASYAHINETEIFIVFETRVAGTRVQYAERYPTPFKIAHYCEVEGLKFSSLMIGSSLDIGIVKLLKQIERINIYHNNSSDNSKKLELRPVTTEIRLKQASIESTEYFKNETWPYLSGNSVNVLYK